ncbi:MAG: hypothetical protein V1837_07440 [Candidatus Woesearchaeota archaeon]
MLSKPFEWMTEYVYERILPKVIPHLDHKEGRVIGLDGKILGEGPDFENPYYNGLIMAFDGEKILAKASEVMGRPNAIGEPVKVDGKEGFKQYLVANDKRDIKLLYNSQGELMYSMRGEFKNWHPDFPVDENLERRLSKDFLSLDGHIPVQYAGTKTWAAVLTPALVNKLNLGGDVDTILLQETPVGAGIGRLSHFDKDGLVEDLHFVYNKQYNALQGIYRQRVDGKMVEVKNQKIQALNEMLVQKYGSKVEYQPCEQAFAA